MRLQAIHLDHGQDIKAIQACIENGFISVIIDGSHLEFQENIAITKEIVKTAMKRAVRWVRSSKDFGAWPRSHQTNRSA